MRCIACKGFGLVVNVRTAEIVACPSCDGTGSTDAADLAGIGIAEGGRPHALPMSIQARRRARQELANITR